jgi:hypothetical protein
LWRERTNAAASIAPSISTAPTAVRPDWRSCTAICPNCGSWQTSLAVAFAVPALRRASAEQARFLLAVYTPPNHNLARALVYSCSDVHPDAALRALRATTRALSKSVFRVCRPTKRVIAAALVGKAERRTARNPSSVGGHGENDKALRHYMNILTKRPFYVTIERQTTHNPIWERRPNMAKRVEIRYCTA